MAMYGTMGNETINGSVNEDALYGLGGNDILDGGGNNWQTGVINAASGVVGDLLAGGAGDDTYLFGLGSGQVTINEYGSYGGYGGGYSGGYGGVDRVVFTGLNRADVTFQKFNTVDLKITINSTGESVYIQCEYHGDTAYAIESFVFTDGTLTQSAINTQLSTGSSGDDTLWGWIGNDNLAGLAGSDRLIGFDGNDTLDGGGNDWQTGGVGDLLVGNAGDDTYLFGLGSGQVNIVDYSSYNDDGGGVDRVVFTGLNKADVTFQKFNTWDLKITINSTGESVYIQYEYVYDGNTAYNIESFVFNDGTLTQSAINTQLSTGSSGDDTLWGWIGNDNLAGLAGSDSLYGLGGNDTLDGGGNNWQTGGVGDFLSGGYGDDTYLFGLGSGQVTINEYGSYAGYGVDRVVFTGLNKADVTFQKFNTRDLKITINSTGESVYIQDEYFGDDRAGYNIESFVFNDGTLTQSAINTQLSTGSSGDDTLWGWIGNDNLAGLAGSDSLYGLEGNDTLDGGGNNWQTGGAGDFLSGGNGDDTYLFGLGSGQVTINEGHGVDRVVFTGLNKADVTFQRVSYNDLKATIISTGESVTIQNGYSSVTAYNIESFVFNDGILTMEQTLLIHQGGAGDDILYGGNGNDSLYGAAGNDILIDNGGGNDLLDGGAGVDIMIGGTGNDSYIVDNIGDVVNEISTLATEIDTVTSAISYALTANLENLILSGTAAINGTGNALNNALTGNTGANSLDGGAGADTMTGGLGNDTYTVDNTGDVVTETSTLATEIDSVNSSISYTLFANVENLTLTGTAAINSTGNTLNNQLIGNTANNTLNGWLGADTLIGSAGNDAYVVENAGDVVTEYLNQGVDTVYSAITYGLTSNVEQLVLTGTSALNGTGNTLNNYIAGNTANNVLTGGLGADSLIAQGGADTLVGGLGKDTINLAEATAATDTVRVAAGDSLVSSYDLVNGFRLGTSVVSTAGIDKLDLANTVVAANAVAVNGIDSGIILSHRISNGMISFDDVNAYTSPLAITSANLGNVFSYLQANITGGNTVAFVSAGNTFVFQDGGVVNDTLVELVGIAASSVNTTGLGVNALWIV